MEPRSVGKRTTAMAHLNTRNVSLPACANTIIVSTLSNPLFSVPPPFPPGHRFSDNPMPSTHRIPQRGWDRRNKPPLKWAKLLYCSEPIVGSCWISRRRFKFDGVVLKTGRQLRTFPSTNDKSTKLKSRILVVLQGVIISSLGNQNQI